MKKYHLIYTFTLFALISCAPKNEEAFRTTASAQSGSMSPSVWASGINVFPLRLDISSDFTVDEASTITATGDQWSTSIENKAQLFDTSLNTSEKGTNNLDNYLDGTMGIYKLTSWPKELPATALAVTQIFGTRKYIGSSSEIIEMSHADILVNFENFSFTTSNSYGYDLQTVILHEMGHFLGLYHDNTSKSESVMYPTISQFYNNRIPKDKDIINLASKYGINTHGVSPMMNRRSLASVETENTQSEEVVIHFEIHAGGDEKIYIAKRDGRESPYLELQRLRQLENEKERQPNQDHHDHKDHIFKIKNPEIIIPSNQPEKKEIKKGTV